MSNPDVAEEAARILERAKHELLAVLLTAPGRPEVVAPEQPPVPLPEPLVNTRAAASHLSVSERQLRQLVSEQAVPFHRVGTSVRFKLSELDEWSRVPQRRLKAV